MVSTIQPRLCAMKILLCLFIKLNIVCQDDSQLNDVLQFEEENECSHEDHLNATHKEVDVNYHKSDIYMGNLCACQRKDLSSAVDPLTGLNARDIELIKMSWFNMCKHASVKDTGTAFFLKLFDDHPYMKNYFAMFTDKERNVGITSVFRAHAISVFCELFKYIDYLEDPEMVVALIEKRTRGHFRNDVTLTDMENLGKSLLEFLEERLGGLASVPEVLEAWAKFLKLHNAVFQNKCDELVMAQKMLNQGRAGL